MAKDELEKRVAPEEEAPIVVDENQDQEDQNQNQEPDTTVVDDAPSEDMPVADDTATEDAEFKDDPIVVTPVPITEKQPGWKRALTWVATHKKFTIPGAVVAVLLVLATVPFTRYALAGLVLTQRYSVKVVDAETKQPVSSAEVVLAGKKATTDGRGQATVEVAVGNATLSVSKKYYKTASQDVLVPIGSQKQPQQVSLTATGRQVPMVVVNSITKKPVADVELRALDTKAKTDKQGKAVLVVPAGKETVDVTVEAKGYNPLKQVVIFQQGVVVETSVNLVPAGKVYFLSNKSGKIDVVKANLDGSERTVVLPGTGKEDRYNTSLLASRDWRYLALHARRDSDKAKLYLIDTATDKLTVMDEGNASFELTGWSGHHFVYKVTRASVPESQSGRQALKSFNAQAGKITTLDETRAEDDINDGFDNAGYVYEWIGAPYILEDEIVYAKEWQRSAGYEFDQRLWEGKQTTFNSVKPDGKAKKVVKSYSRVGQSLAISIRSYGPQEVYVLPSMNSSAPIEEYEDGQMKVATGVTRDEFYTEVYPTYLVSPSGERTVWTEGRDGKNVFFVGDKHGENKKELGALRELGAYGWFGEEYLLAAKNGSELYILPAEQFDEKAPLKITDYYRARTYEGYGYGYGGL